MNHDVYMQGQMRLGAWILFHLKNQDIPGLQYASNSESHHSEIIFQFPWIKMGEHNWEDAWSIIKEYGTHKRVPITEDMSVDEKRNRLKELKNKFRNAMMKSSEFEELDSLQSNTKMFRFKPQSKTTKRKKRRIEDLDSFENIFASTSQQQFAGVPSVTVGSQFVAEAVAGTAYSPMVAHANYNAGNSNLHVQALPNSDWSMVNHGDIDNMQSLISDVGFTNQTDMNNEAQVVDTGLTYQFLDTVNPSNQYGFPQPGTHSRRSDISEHKLVSGNNSSPLRPPSRPGNDIQRPLSVQSYKSSGYVSSPSRSSSSQHPSQQSPSASNQKNLVVKQPGVAIKNLGDLQNIANIEDEEFQKFNVIIKYGQVMQLSAVHNLSAGGLQVTHDRSKNEKFKKYEPNIWELLEAAGENFIELPKYNGAKENVNYALSCFGGGLILKYSQRCLHVYRLCQTRVYVEGHYHSKRKKILRCCKMAPTECVNAFSYHIFSSDIQAANFQEADVSNKSMTKVIIGSDDICIEIVPVVAASLYGATKVKQERPCLVSSLSSDANSLDKLSERFGTL